MKHVLVQYRVLPDRAAENEALVRDVYEELHGLRPAGLRYATYVLPDGVTFVHLAQVDTPDGRSPLPDVPAFKRFLAGIDDRCEDGPHAREVRALGSFDGSE